MCYTFRSNSRNLVLPQNLVDENKSSWNFQRKCQMYCSELQLYTSQDLSSNTILAPSSMIEKIQLFVTRLVVLSKHSEKL